ncbi:hypothetical protein D3C81_2009140 [compost metagenome]
MQPTEVDNVGANGADLGNQSAEVFLTARQAFLHHRLDTALGQLRRRSICQAFAVGVFVIDYRDFFALEHVDNIVTGNDALLVVTSAHAEHGG